MPANSRWDLIRGLKGKVALKQILQDKCELLRETVCHEPYPTLVLATKPTVPMIEMP